VQSTCCGASAALLANYLRLSTLGEPIGVRNFVGLTVGFEVRQGAEDAGRHLRSDRFISILRVRVPLGPGGRLSMTRSTLQFES